MKKWSTFLMVVALGALIPSPVAAQAPGKTSAVCNMTFIERASPGFTLTPSSGLQSSAGTAPIYCAGTIQGHRVTGPGTVSNQGNYHNSTCVLDHADGTFSITVPTDAGPRSLEGTFKVTRAGALLSVELELADSRGVGSAAVVPIKGDCVLSPVTEVLVVMSVSSTTSRRQPSRGAATWIWQS